MGRERTNRQMLFVCAFHLLTIFQPLAGGNASANERHKRSVTVADLIGMTRLASPGYFRGGSSKGLVADFSPDGKKFVVILRKGNPQNDTNEFSLLLYRTDEIYHPWGSANLLRWSSSSSRDAIGVVRWMDNQTLAFLGERPGELPQVYKLDIQTRLLTQLTRQQTAITAYDITPDGQSLLYEADPRKEQTAPGTPSAKQGIVVEGQWLPDLVEGNYALRKDQEVFLVERGHPPVHLVIDPRYHVEHWNRLSLSPDGGYGVIGVSLRELPSAWAEYQDSHIRSFMAFHPTKGMSSAVSVGLLYDIKNKLLKPAVEAPAEGYHGNIAIRWAADSRAFFFHTYLPLEGADSIEREARRREIFGVKVSVPAGDVQKVKDTEWPIEPGTRQSLDVTLEEDVNSTPKIFVSDLRSHRRRLLVDLNPQLSDVDLGRVEIVDLKIRDRLTIECGLYLPPDLIPGKRYPLVIQTHGFDPTRFSMDGRGEWSSAFAARALAAKEIIVLQTFAFKDPDDATSYNQDHAFGVSREQADRNLQRAVFETAIENLDRKGLIDRTRVGIAGFSRTVCAVAYALTHSAFHFASAALVDGIDCGYFQEIAFPQIAWDSDLINGGKAPFGEGLSTWLQESPSFSLSRVNTPVSLLALTPTGALTQWEWYAGLLLQNKPVDFVLIPDAGDGDNHLLTKPWERKIAQQGLVDWFCFWLKGEEDPDPRKSSCYKRWRELLARTKRKTDSP